MDKKTLPGLKNPQILDDVKVNWQSETIPAKKFGDNCIWLKEQSGLIALCADDSFSEDKTSVYAQTDFDKMVISRAQRLGMTHRKGGGRTGRRNKRGRRH